MQVYNGLYIPKPQRTRGTRLSAPSHRSHPKSQDEFLVLQQSSVSAMAKFITSTLAVLLGVASAIPTPESNQTLGNDELSKRGTSFWYANMDHTGQYRGYAPDLGNDFSYPVFEAVNPGDGAGIQKAINDAEGSSRHGQWLASQPRVRQQIPREQERILFSPPYGPNMESRSSTSLQGRTKSAPPFG